MLLLYVLKCYLRYIVTVHGASTHRRTSRGVGGAAAPPLDLGKVIIFLAKAKFFGQKPAAKIAEFIPSSEIKCPKSGIFTNNY